MALISSKSPIMNSINRSFSIVRRCKWHQCAKFIKSGLNYRVDCFELLIHCTSFINQNDKCFDFVGCRSLIEVWLYLYLNWDG
jgi:hypothetical protein